MHHLIDNMTIMAAFALPPLAIMAFYGWYEEKNAKRGWK